MKNEKNIKFLNFLISYDLKLQKLHIKSYYFISKLTNLIYTHLFLRGAENETIDVRKWKKCQISLVSLAHRNFWKSTSK